MAHIDKGKSEVLELDILSQPGAPAKGLIVILRGMIRECLALMTDDEKYDEIGHMVVLSYELIRFVGDVDYRAMSAVVDNLAWVYHFDYTFGADEFSLKVTRAFILAEDIVADMSIDMVIAKVGDKYYE